MKAPPRTILLAEDDPDIQELATMALEAVGGFTVVACNNGHEAIREAQRLRPDLITGARPRRPLRRLREPEIRSRPDPARPW